MGNTYVVEYFDYHIDKMAQYWCGDSLKEAIKKMIEINNKGYPCVRLTYRGDSLGRDIVREVRGK
jgi:hypothetical protein